MEAYGRMTVKHAINLAAPHTWAASVCPAIFGIVYCALMGPALSPLRSAGLFLTCVLMQSAVNTLNDYVDYVRGTDSIDDNVEEHDSVLVYGRLNPKSVRNLGCAYLFAAAVLGLVSAYGAGINPVIIGVLGGATVTLYSAGPMPISYLPAGELVSGVAMGGLIPLGITSVADGEVHPEVLLYSIPLILGIALIMMSNNGCDIEKDIRAGRKTLPVRIGRSKTTALFHTLVGIWLICVILMPVLFGIGGLAGCVVLVIAGRKCFPYLRGCTLDPSTRITQMKTIVRANLVAGGAYIVSFTAIILIKLYG